MLEKPDRLTARCARSFSLLLAATLPVSAQTIPAFPGAEGYGAYAKGGRGGDVYHVTNLNASGAGSFIEGISTVPSAGRTIIFDVSGYIRFPSGSGGTRMTASKVTIAGQTAPGDGVGFYNNFFRISGDDVILRHLRFRRGKTDSSGDCVGLDSGCQDAVLDHISIAFSTDENISSFGSPPENISFQWSLNSWGLESHSAGGLWDQDHASCHHTLWAHNHTRNPKARPNSLLEWTNNVTFDWDIGFIMGDSQTPATWKSNVRGNYFVCPPGNIRNTPLEKANLDRNGYPNFSVYVDNNLHDIDGDGTLNGTDRGYSIVKGTAYDATTNPTGNYIKLAAPASGSSLLAIDPPLLAYKKVASDAGALRLSAGYTGPLRDEVDTRMISNLVNQTRNHISNPNQLSGISNGGLGTLNSTAAPVDTDQDGMPDYYETALGWNPASQDHNTALANSGGVISGTTFLPPATVAGYTRLEEYLHFLAIPHGTVPKNLSGTPSSIQLDLEKYTSGFASSPNFTLSNITGGAAVQSGTGNSIVTFTPTLNHVGRARFDFTVTDSQGSTWTRTFGLLVSQNGLPRDLNWQGDGSANDWDISTNNWLQDGSPVSFSSGDRAAFDDSGSRSPAMDLNGTVSPLTMDVNATGNYNFGGSGTIGSGTLTKRGTGTLTFSNSAGNGFSEVNLDSGTIVAGRTDSLGTGAVTIGDASLNLPSGGGTFSRPLSIIGNSTLNWTSNSNMYFESDVSGAGQFNLNFSNKLFTLEGSWSDFAGTLSTGSSTGTLRINDYGTTDFSKMRFQMGNAWLRHHLNGALGVSFGELNSTSGARLTGGDTNYAVTDTYTIGGLNTDSVFAGTIADGTGTNHKLGIAKTGTGSLLLSGASTHTGPTDVNAGSVIISGSIGNSATTVADGALLGGAGSVGGTVTANSGSTLSPGNTTGAAGTFTASTGLTLDGTVSLPFDLSSSISSGNDKIVVSTGTLAISWSTLDFNINQIDGVLSSGTYNLIGGSATMSANPAPGLNLAGLPVGSRQTFSLQRQANGSSPAFVNLVVSGTPPASLVWTGNNGGGLWDWNSTANFSGGPTATFYNADSVSFNDSSTVGTVVLSGTLEPRVVTVANSSARAYTFTGSGEIGGAASLVKTGSGTLTLASINSHTGGTSIGAGSTIQLADDTANAGALGSGPVTFLGGTLNMYRNNSSYNSATYQLVVPTGQSGTLNADDRCDLYGTLNGGGTLNLRIPWIRTNLFANWSAFSGTINAVASSGYGEFRIASNYSPPGFPDAIIDLGTGIVMMHTGILNPGAGTTIAIGALSGTAGSNLKGGVTPGRALTYQIGGRGTHATFAGTIGEQSPGDTLTNIVKTGAGTWTLSGTSAWEGGTTVEQGTLAVTGDITSNGAVAVASSAALSLTNGAIATDSVNIDFGSSLSGYGSITGDLITSGNLELRGFSTGTPGTLTVQGSVYLGASSLIRMRAGSSSDQITVSGDLALDGTLEASLSPGSTFGRFPLMTHGGELTGNLILTGIPGGTTAHLSTTVAGQLDLVIDDSDEDTLPDSWETHYFGNLASGPDDDNDGDGQTNTMELLTGTDPDNGASRFAATMTPLGGSQFDLTWPSVPLKSYRIETSGTLAGAWSPLVTLPAADSPATTTSHVITTPVGPDKWFYRVALDP